MCVDSGHSFEDVHNFRKLWKQTFLASTIQLRMIKGLKKHVVL